MSSQNPRVLCVDDEPMNLNLLEAMLIPQGYETIKAENGVEAWAKVQSEHVDVVLLDVMMPGLDGFEVCRRIKSDERYRSIPVIMLTAYAAKEKLRMVYRHRAVVEVYSWSSSIQGATPLQQHCLPG